MSDESYRQRLAGLADASPEWVQLGDTTRGLDEFPSEADGSFMVVSVAGGRHVRFDWARHARPLALVASALLATTTGVLVLQSRATPRAVSDPMARTTVNHRFTVTDSATAPSSASATPNEPTGGEPVQAVAVGPARISLLPTPFTGTPPVNDGPPAPTTRSTAEPVTNPVTAPVSPPRNPVALDVPTDPSPTPAEASVASAAPSLAAVPQTVIAPQAAFTPAVATPVPPTPALPPPAPDAAMATASRQGLARATAADAVVEPVARPAGRDLDAREIERVLGQYRNAYNRLDARAAVAVWPSVNEKALAKAFDRLEGQDVSFDNCSIEVGGARASAACTGTARYVPKVGNRTSKAEARQWRFILRKERDGWLIQQIEAR